MNMESSALDSVCVKSDSCIKWICFLRLAVPKHLADQVIKDKSDMSNMF